MGNVHQFNLDLKNKLRDEATQGFTAKWKKTVTVNNQRTNIWIKAGSQIWEEYVHDSLAECIVSVVARELGISDVVDYKVCILNFVDNLGVKRKTLGCYSFDFTKENEKVYDIDELRGGETYNMEYFELIQYVNEKTGISKDAFREYLDRVLLLDSLTLNEDRRLGNLAVIFNRKTNKYRICPVFDNGQGFGLHNNKWMNDGVWDDWCISNFYAKPFSQSFDEMLYETRYVTDERYKAKAREMLSKGFNKTFKIVDSLFEYFGDDYDEKWDTEYRKKVDKIRIKVDEPIRYMEKESIKSQLEGRRQYILNNIIV